MTKRKTTPPAFQFVGGNAHAAQMLKWAMTAEAAEGVSPLVRAAAWALSYLPFGPRERAEFLENADLEVENVPGGTRIREKSLRNEDGPQLTSPGEVA